MSAFIKDNDLMTEGHSIVIQLLASQDLFRHDDELREWRLISMPHSELAPQDIS